MPTTIYRIYKVTNLNNDKKYIGWTDKPCVEDRLTTHINSANHGSDYHFHRAIRKHGRFSFKIEQIDQCYDNDEKNRLEKHWIAHYDTFLGEGYNMTEGGEGVSGFKRPRPEHEKIQISETLTGLKRIRVSCVKCKTETDLGHLKRLHIDAKVCGKENDKRDPQEKVKCPHCPKIGGKSNMLSFHFDNCLKNPNLTKEEVEKLKQERTNRRKGISS